ncbi:hypothetical protein CZP2022_17 [Vibrio phage C-ZP2022]|nr:hypothetical protein CZP2022_17 [Vibrio phage C-ZP2022]
MHVDDSVTPLWMAIIFSPVVFGLIYDMFKPKKKQPEMTAFDLVITKQFRLKAIELYWTTRKAGGSITSAMSLIHQHHIRYCCLYPHNREIQNYHVQSEVAKLTQRWNNSKRKPL